MGSIIRGNGKIIGLPFNEIAHGIACSITYVYGLRIVTRTVP